MLGIPIFSIWVAEVILFASIAVMYLWWVEFVPWYVWFGFGGAFIMLALLALAIHRVQSKLDS